MGSDLDYNGVTHCRKCNNSLNAEREQYEGVCCYCANDGAALVAKVRELEAQLSAANERADREVKRYCDLEKCAEELQAQLVSAKKDKNKAIKALGEAEIWNEKFQAERDQLQTELERIKAYTGTTEAYTCPLCKYEDGILREQCGPHQIASEWEIDALHSRVKQIEAEAKLKDTIKVLKQIDVEPRSNGAYDKLYLILNNSTLDTESDKKLSKWKLQRDEAINDISNQET